MDNGFEINTSDYQSKNGMYIAYTLNNKQSVKCTHIGSEPMFYIDEENISDDEILLDDETYDLIQEELKTLTSDLAGIEKNASAEVTLNADLKKQETILEFMADSMLISETPFILDRAEIKMRLINMIQKSRMASALYEAAQARGVDIALTDQTDKAAYDEGAKTIFVRDDLDFNTQVLLTCEALRHVWQEEHGANKHPLSFHPDHAVLASRAQEADLKAALVRCAWELKLAGEAQFWEMVQNSTMSDLARGFAREAHKDFRSLDNGRAAASLFEAWFLSERCNQQDKALIQSMLAENNNFVFDTVESSHRSLIKMMMALGEQPHGKNYLARFTDLIINDPLFTDVRDRSNANFLWFVKFERAYDEAEQELQSDGVTTLPGIDLAQKETQKDTNHDKTQSAFRENILKPEQSSADNLIIVDFGASAYRREEKLL